MPGQADKVRPHSLSDSGGSTAAAGDRSTFPIVFVGTRRHYPGAWIIIRLRNTVEEGATFFGNLSLRRCAAGSK